jgi:hypothetical protein
MISNDCTTPIGFHPRSAPACAANGSSTRRYREANGISGRTLTLKIKYAEFQQVTHSRSASVPLSSKTEIEHLVDILLEPIFPVRKGIDWSVWRFHHSEAMTTPTRASSVSISGLKRELSADLSRISGPTNWPT